MSFWKESVFTIAELSKAIVANAQSIIAKLENNTNGLGAIKTGVDGANSALGDSTNGLAAIKTAVDAIGSGGNSVIKSIQRGFATTGAPSSGNYYADITISAVNRQKAILICEAASNTLYNGSIYERTSSGGVAYGRFLSDSVIRIVGVTDRVSIAWQVIEFN